jgi:hypothetical protein
MIRTTLTAVLVALFAVEATAEVTRVDVAKRADVGMSGYEKIIGMIHFAIDPKDPGNQVIVGLDKAPRNASGKVEFSADLYILQPRDASRSNGVALVDVVNRGRKMTLNNFSAAAPSIQPRKPTSATASSRVRVTRSSGLAGSSTCSGRTTSWASKCHMRQAPPASLAPSSRRTTAAPTSRWPISSGIRSRVTAAMRR